MTEGFAAYAAMVAVPKMQTPKRTDASLLVRRLVAMQFFPCGRAARGWRGVRQDREIEGECSHRVTSTVEHRVSFENRAQTSTRPFVNASKKPPPIDFSAFGRELDHSTRSSGGGASSACPICPLRRAL